MNRTKALVIRGRRVVTPAGVEPAAVVIESGRIRGVVPLDGFRAAAGSDVVEAGEALVLPGLVDTHVHVNEPGRTEWEGFETATDAAAAAGITSLVDMPLNCSPVTCSVGALAAKREAARGKLRVDCGFWGGVVPGNRAELSSLSDSGVLGFKCFLVDSGLPEFPPVAEPDLRAAMEEIARLGLPLLAHAELPGPIEAAASSLPDRSRSHADWVASRPPEAEVEAVCLLIRLARETGCRVHVVHVSARECLPLIADARRAGLRISAETCPHFLTFASDEIPDGATQFKSAPPIRDAKNREALWEGLLDGTLDLVASDHSPCPPAARVPESGDFFAAWGGIASLEVGPSAVWTGVLQRGLEPSRFAGWMSAAPARLAGLADAKGRIAAGCDADLVIFDPAAEYEVDADALRTRHRASPYAGRVLRGVVRRTYLRGRLVYADGESVGRRCGRQLERQIPGAR